MTPLYVIGSSNTDMVVKCDQLPAPSETVIGGKFLMTAGGKGANQAVAAARLGGQVKLVANLGDDLFGRQSLLDFRKEKIDTSFVSIDSEYASGVALINVDQKGENTITVAPGSNRNLKITQVEKALQGLPCDTIVLLQLEIPINTAVWVIRQCHQQGHRVLLNPSPAQKFSNEVYKELFLITPNEKEAEVLTGVAVTDIASAEKAASHFEKLGVRNVVITLGAKGAYLHSKEHNLLIAAPVTSAMDTTGAGDCFNGALAVALSENIPLDQAVAFAVKAASISVTRMGAQASMPTREELVT